MLNGSMKKGLELILAGAVAIGSIGLTNGVRAQDNNSAQFFLGSTLNLGVFDTGNPKKDRFVRRLGHLNAHLGLYGMHHHIHAPHFHAPPIHAPHIHIPKRSIIYPYEDTPGQNMGASFFLYNKWEDKDGNGKLGNLFHKNQFLDELIGVNKGTFYDDEKLFFRINTKNMKGHNVTFVLTDPNDRIVYTDSNYVNRSRWHDRFDLSLEGFREQTLRNHGYGQYNAAVFVDFDLLGFRDFNWMPSKSFYMGDWDDSNKDGRLDASRELSNVGKKIFGPNDHIIVSFDTYNHEGHQGEVKMFDSNNNVIHSISHHIPANGYKVWIDVYASRVIHRHGYGDYSAVSYIDGKPQDKLDFNIDYRSEQLSLPPPEPLPISVPEVIN